MTREKKIKHIGLFVVIGFAFSVFYHYWKGVYLGKGYPKNTFLFKPEDRWNDFFNVYRHSVGLSPYLTEDAVPRNYFPFSYVVSWPFTLLKPAFSFFVFTAGSLAFLLRAAWKNLLQEDRYDTVLAVFAFVLLSYPVLFLLDRGNFEIVVFALLYLFVYLYRAGRDLPAVACLAGATAMKLFPAVFFVLLLADRKYRKTAYFFLAVAALSLGSLFSFGGGFAENVRALGQNLAVAQSSLDTSIPSVQHSLNVFALVKVTAGRLIKAGPVHDVLNAFLAFKVYFAFSLLLFGFTAWYVAKVEKLYWKKVALLVFVMLLLPQISFDYRLIHIFIPLYLFINAEPCDRDDPHYATLFALLLIPKDYVRIAGDVTIAVLLNPLIMLWFMYKIISDGLKEKYSKAGGAA